MGAEDDLMLPMAVSHVCRHWRYLALRTPTLWRRISLDSRLRMWSERLARARACTLDVEILPQALPITPRTRREYLDAQTVQLYMHMTSPYINRWRSLTIDFQHYAPYLWNAALSVCCGFGPGVRAPRLEHLSLVHPNNDDTQEFTLFNGHAPLLRSVTLNGIRLTWMPSLFANITSLDYTHHGFTRGEDAEIEIFKMLKVCSRLRELRLAFPTHSRKTMRLYDSPLPARERIPFNDLRTLTIHVEGADIPSALIALIARFDLRRLRHLTLSSSALTMPTRGTHPVYNHYSTHTAFPFFSRIRKFQKALPRLPSLTRLEVKHAWCRLSFLRDVLTQQVPRLDKLTLHSPFLDEGFLWDLGEICRGRYRVEHNVKGNGMPRVIYMPLRVLEVVGSGYVHANGIIDVIKRMLGGGVVWVKEIWVRDCVGVNEEVVQRAWRFGVPVRIFRDASGLGAKLPKGGGSGFAALGTNALTWTRRRAR